uniref:Uncharacterized protein n=1 Tax=Arundo donax TaxID=35708 RepID=A0A0A9BGX9_ARUDO
MQFIILYLKHNRACNLKFYMDVEHNITYGW